MNPSSWLPPKVIAVFAAIGIAIMIGVGVAPAASAAPSKIVDCFDETAPTTVEEQRLSDPSPQEILRLSDFDRFGTLFKISLCASRSFHTTDSLVNAQGIALWEVAVARAQGRLASDDLAREDDRPLYWARLQMTQALRQWEPRFDLSDEQRAELLKDLETRSRGQDSVRFPAGNGVKRILMSGFDTFSLDQNIRNSNPSGASALALDGTIIRTSSGVAFVETVMLPVLWTPFEQGMVEETFLPHLRPGPRQVDLFTTVSQGRINRFDLEVFNGAWQSGRDNNRENRANVAPIAPGIPTVTPQPQFTESTLPMEEMVAASTGRFPVFRNTQVTEIPAGSTTPVVRPDGPTPGSQARAGGGGAFLSNASAYRTTLLRDALGVDLPGGHIHTAVLQFAPDNNGAITDPVFEQNRRDIIAQVKSLITVAVGTLDRR